MHLQDSAAHAAIEAVIAATIAGTRAAIEPAGAVAGELVEAIAAAAAGGKRMRAIAVLASYAAHGGESLEAAAGVAAAVELFQAAALVHDDLLDDAHLRRGRPTAHVAFAKSHAGRGDAGDAARFGTAGAVLAGDLCLVAANRAMASAAIGPHGPATAALFTQMSELVTAGQYLDMRLAAAPLTALPRQLDDIRATMRAKTASYTAEFPLALGASAALGFGPHVAAARAAGVPAGIAFQLRDDLLGIVGSPDVTGKPVGGDIVEGKRTVPLWLAWTRSDAAGRATLAAAVGRPSATAADVEAAIAVIRATGAIDEVERQIADLGAQARARLDQIDIDADGRAALGALLDQWGVRSA